MIINTHSKLSYQNNHLIFRDAYTTERIHLSEIDMVILETTDIAITTMLIKRLIDEKIVVIFCDDKRLPTAKLMPYYSRHDSSLQLGKQVNWEGNKKLAVWLNIIHQKILNQATHLLIQDKKDKFDRLIELNETLSEWDEHNIEAHAARIYFNSLFGNDFSRQDNNDINAGLDYGYTLLMSMFAREIVASGCMTQFGLKHSNQYNEFNLASDFMEPFRPLIDAIVYENSDTDFKNVKLSLLQIFDTQYKYNGKDMFLNNIISDYTKNMVSVLNNETQSIPEFLI
ncbi:CRISPR-associated endonuclease Cas1 [Companilactobacillus sp. RD055328]|nr:CRISPR-associated endonuclease Cas1 [Companilactobacillus sp. RD055328]